MPIDFKPLDKATFDKFKKRTFHRASTEEWIEREQRQTAAGEKTTTEILSDMKRVYQDTLAEINREIEAFYGRYAKENGITLAEAHKRLDPGELKSAREEMRRFYEFADPSRVGKDKSEAFRTELRELGARKYLSRLEEIKMRMKFILARLASKEETAYDKALFEEYKTARDMAYYDIGKNVGFFVEFASPSEQLMLAAVKKKWLGENYSDRIWKDKGKLLQAIEKDFMTGIARGQNPKKIARAISKDFELDYKHCERLARTEAIHLMNEVTADSYRENGIEKYQYVCDLSDRTCDICGGLDGQVFELRYKEEGVNYPLMHVNCVLGDNIVTAPDAECLTKSVYSGDIIKVTTSNSRGFSVTPNHIMLTARGWVRAKNLVKGDKVIYYSGWDKSLFVSDPADDNGVPTIEQLFTSLAKSTGVRTMPASPKDFKSDIVKDSKIDVILVDSLLRNKADASLLKFISDSSLIETVKAGKSLFTGNCTLAQFLVATGLVADGIVSGTDISSILFGCSFTHHQLVSLRLPSDYDARIVQSASNNRSTDVKSLGKLIDADSARVKSDDFINRQFFAGVGVSGDNSVFFENSRNRLVSTVKNLFQFFNRLSAVVELDDVTGVDVSKSTVHVYDVSSMSTLYLCNGFVSSNCRCSTVPYYDDDLSKLFDNATRIAKDSGGRVIDVPADMTWKEWKEAYGKK